MLQQVAITLFLKNVDLNDLKLCLTFHYNITGRSQHQVLFFQWQGIGPAGTWRSAATDRRPTVGGNKAMLRCVGLSVLSVCPLPVDGSSMYFAGSAPCRLSPSVG